MDVTDGDSVQADFAEILNEVEAVDVLINKAGIMYAGMTEAFSIDQAHEQMNTNYYGAIRTLQTV